MSRVDLFVVLFSGIILGILFGVMVTYGFISKNIREPHDIWPDKLGPNRRK